MIRIPYIEFYRSCERALDACAALGNDIYKGRDKDRELMIKVDQQLGINEYYVFPTGQCLAIAFNPEVGYTASLTMLEPKTPQYGDHLVPCHFSASKEMKILPWCRVKTEDKEQRRKVCQILSCVLFSTRDVPRLQETMK